MSFLLTGCVTFSQKEAEIVGQGVYATGDAITIGRVDEAQKYNNVVKKYFPNPKKPIKVSAFNPTIGQKNDCLSFNRQSSRINRRGSHFRLRSQCSISACRGSRT